MLTQQLRRQFIEYFKKQGHAHIASSAVVPHDDPTLLFTNAGMNQFKELFLGGAERDYHKAVTSQKCIRAGGKHNDLENVGHTARHLTFFEMLGNFSFGDYFKKEAIRMAWEVSTEVFQLDPQRIWPTVFREDDEAFQLWTDYVPAQRISRMDSADNFWAMGDTGPCGPCTELYYDRGSTYGQALSPAHDPAGTRFIEFWNLVFMQYNCKPNRTLEPLPKPCVDTGAGLERLVALKMDVPTLFDTDILRGLIMQVEALSQSNYEEATAEIKPAFCVIADHLRSLAFAIADGAQPSNVERGYVLRKILRRAVRYGRLLGFNRPFLADLMPCLITLMGEDYPELVTAQSRIVEVLTLEEEAFLRTLQRGGSILQQIIQSSQASQNREISGEDAFKLKDTYGLPFEEIVLIAKDSDLQVAKARFDILEAEARERSRVQQKEVHQLATTNAYASFAEKNPPSRFTGYTELSSTATVVGIAKGDEFVATLNEGDEGRIILDQTPFYAEMGGQVGDVGSLTKDNAFDFSVTNCYSPYKGIIVHSGKLLKGFLHVGDSATALVAAEHRRIIANNHTATHLLHWALHKVLGDHVRQAGSVVDAERLRFDFSHHKALSIQELTAIENLVNEKIRANVPVKQYELSYEDAQNRRDIKQFFGDKYGSTVRVIDMDFSKELCGGTHTDRSGSIGYFAIDKESSIAAGVRRLEAVTGARAEELRRAPQELLDKLAAALKVPTGRLCERVEKLKEENKVLQQELQRHQQEQRSTLVNDIVDGAENVNGSCYVIAEVSTDAESLRLIADEVVTRLSSAIVVIGCRSMSSCSAVIRISPDLVKAHFSAAEIAKIMGALIEGRGGGKDNSAQAGGKAPQNLPPALEAARAFILQSLK